MAAVGLLSACSTVMDRRIAEHQETWRGLSEPDQHRLLQGHVRRGDTEGMVRIALGPPDKMLPLTSVDGQRLTVWLYDDPTVWWDPSPFDPASSVHSTSRETSVVFHDGVVADQAATAVEDVAKLAEFRVKPAAENRLARLDSLVALTPGQRMKALDIFEKAKEKLNAFSPGERPAKGRSIRVKMRADIRAMLTAEQQAKYDAAPQYLGGGSTKRP